MPTLERRFVVAKNSVVRKLGEFHLISSVTVGLRARISLRR